MTTAFAAQSQPGFFVPGAEPKTETKQTQSAWARYRTYRRTLAELRALPLRQLHDIGMYPDELTTIARKAVDAN